MSSIKLTLLALFVTPLFFSSMATASTESNYQCYGFYYSSTMKQVIKQMLKDVYVQLHQAKYDQARSSVLVHFIYAHAKKITFDQLLDLVDESPDLDTRETVLTIYLEANISRLSVNDIVQMTIVSPYYETKENILLQYTQKHRHTLKPDELSRLYNLAHNETVKDNLLSVFPSSSIANSR